MSTKRPISIDSPLPPHEVSARLAPHVTADVGPILNQLEWDHDFVGDVGPSALRLRRRHVYMNSLSPVFLGHVERSGEGSRIVGEFRLTGNVTAVTYLFQVAGVLFTAMGVFALIASGKPVALIGTAMGLVFFALGFGARRLQSAGDREDIERLLRAAASPETKRSS